MNRAFGLLLVLGVVGLIGCGGADSTDQPAARVGVATPPAPVAPAAVPEVPTEQPAEVAGIPVTDVPPAVAENTEAVVADVGFGKKGHYDSNDYISVAVSSQFRVQEKLTLLRITQALQQYKAVHEGYPKTHDEFWKEIIEAHGISLPELHNGEVFRYDPQLAKETDGEQSLQILRPKKQ